MRLIDADKLKENFIGVYEDEINFSFDGYAIKCIDDAPSIDIDRPQGEWIEHKWIEYNEELMFEMPMHNYECSKCHSILREVTQTNYCPNCGARMEGVDDDSKRD